jgi:hypothetical protein
MEDFDNLVLQASDILDKQENYQWVLGEISQKIIDQYGYKALTDFSNQINENCGVRRTAGSLRLYAYVYKLSKGLNLPRDLLFSCCLAIVFSNNPEKYAKLAQEGMNRTELRKLIWDDKHAKME